ncbi:hypothetical protein IQ07DRAFT_590724 [Pyrenochaeta sp. DS3sAY3a]|nr:hypothetical protein IQ07DRAFT_590724 [Pyrenochaeta sp. DS3sAY3a]
MASSSRSDSFVEHFKLIEELYAKTALGEEQWYLIVLSVFTSLGKCDLVADLYTYLVALPQYSTPTERQDLMKRLREALVKITSVIGVARPLEAIININNVTAPEDRDYSFSREDWKSGAENVKRGEAWLRKLYSEHFDSTMTIFDAQKDFGWISSEITYGLYLSDHRILDGVETELCVLSGLFCQGLPRMVGWHLRACRRIGLSSEDCEIIQQCIEASVEFLGVEIKGMPRVKDIEHEVGAVTAE